MAGGKTVPAISKTASQGGRNDDDTRPRLAPKIFNRNGSAADMDELTDPNTSSNSTDCWDGRIVRKEKLKILFIREIRGQALPSSRGKAGGWCMVRTASSPTAYV